ncbi:Small, acid-soluble spore protein H 1 [Bacillus cereus Rock4-18]|nr:Small, acid-soluble spore protein H 1 [Bacillus cereus Rock4-18]
MQFFKWCFNSGNNYKIIGVYFKVGEKQWFDEDRVVNIAK